MAEQPEARAADTADFTFTVGEMQSDVLKVTGFTGEEGLSRLFGFRIELCSDDANIDFNEVVGESCVLEIAGAHGSRYVCGIVRQFEQTGEGVGLSYYAAEIVPLHWYLTKRFKTRIFREHNCEDMSVPGIIKKVLDDAGIPEERFRFALQATYAARDFVVQYRETDMDFISRLMEHEGIFYFFEHSAEGHTMVFGDADVAHVDTPNEAEYPFRDPNSLVPEKEFVYHARECQAIQFASVCLDDFNFRQPTVALRSNVKADQFTSLEFSDHPGEYKENAVGDQYAQVRLEEFQCERRVVNMAATIRGLMPGFKFSLTEHPRTTLNIEYLVTQLTHRATQHQSAQEESQDAGTKHEVDVRSIPADVPYRPQRTTSKPIVVGTQTALVVGPDGEEIYTDDDGYGRVKVQFHWDLEGEHDENSSCWIRVGQGWAGGNYGMIYLPRVGQEVIVGFIEGNPDHPIIIGRVYNNDNMPPYKLPDEKTKSTTKSRSSKGGGGFNEIRLEDKKGDEQIFMHAEKDLDLRIKNDERDWIGRDKHEIIKRNQKKQIGGSEGRAVGGDQITEVGGDRTVKVKGSGVVDVDGDHKVLARGDLALGASKSFKLIARSDGEIRAVTLVLEADAITLKSGDNFITIDGDGVTIIGSSVKINSGGLSRIVAGINTISAMSPAEPDEAATGDPGQDYTYEQERKEYDPLDDAALHDEDESDEKHWIGVRLYDDNGMPLVGERYIVVLPDGETVARGTTNRDGEAEIRGIEPGSCEIKFPALDANTWEAGPPPGGIAPTNGEGGGSGGGGGGGGSAGTTSGGSDHSGGTTSPSGSDHSGGNASRDSGSQGDPSSSEGSEQPGRNIDPSQGTVRLD